MKSDKIFDAISDIDDDLIESAEINKNKKIYGRSWFRWSSAAALFIIAVVILAVSISFDKNDPPTDDTVSSGIESSYSYLSNGSENNGSTTQVAVIEEITSEAGLVIWNGKTVSYNLYEKLKNADDDESIVIIAAPAVNSEFVYNGKTIGEYEKEMSDEKLLLEKSYQLLKDGDQLKDKLDNENGWIESEENNYYNTKIAFYGTDFLSIYIVDGQFLKEKLENDIETLSRQNNAWKAYQDALTAYYSQTRKSLYLTKNEFASFASDDEATYTFYLSDE